MNTPKSLFLIFTLNALCLTAALAQSSATPASATDPKILCQSTGAQPRCNGISVGRPKIFDNRSLTLQIENLQKVLKQQQSANPTIDLKSVMGALANTQGLTQSELSTVLSIVGNPTPATSLTTDAKTGNVDSNGNPLPNSTDTQTTQNVASVTPTAPTFDSFAALPTGLNPTFGSSASDLLNDQVNLSYQITNLQMILERALSDRLYADGNPCANGDRPNCTRLQTVLGFNVTIDPPRIANDAVAVVEITLDTKKSGQLLEEQPSLVAVMPQEKTYNSATLSSSSHAYSGAAVAGAFQLSGGLRKRNQTFYVYKDTDTLSYERMTQDGELVFGWMFRPVLGRRSISPGLRQLFAVVSLPDKDCDHLDIKSDKAKSCDVQITPSIRTYWKKYDRATQTSFAKQDANRAKQFWYGLSASLARPQIFSMDSYMNALTYPDLTVRSSAFYEEALKPFVEDVSWHATGEKSVIVSVQGRNFFTDTQVKLGDTTYSADAKNLAIKSDQSFDLITTIDQLTAGPGSILGRYGLSVPIQLADSPAVSESIKDGFQIENPLIGPAIDGYRSLDISLIKRISSDQTDQYGQDQRKLADLKKKSNELEADYENKNSALDAKNKALAKLKPFEKSMQLLTDVKTLSDNAAEAKDAFESATTAFEHSRRDFYNKYGLLSHASPRSPSITPPQTPILSVNGTALKMPYEIYDRAEADFVPEHVQIRASFPDKLITDGVAQIKVSWPFYNPDRWTNAILYTDPSGQFKLDRVSDKTIIIRREGIAGFDSSNINPKSLCWSFIGGDSKVELATDVCIPPTPSADCSDKTKASDPKNHCTPPIITGLKNAASVTVDEKQTLPSHAVLLDPDGAIYHLTIPELADKKPDAAKPIAMKQNDAAWIKITLPAGKSAKTVEANGSNLQWRPVKADPKNPPKPDDKTPQTIEVEITRALTAKSGSVDVTVLDASGASIARQTIAIACTQCTEKKGDQQ